MGQRGFPAVTVIALGTFDGVHRGHQKVLAKAVARAKKLKVPAIAVTFSPHPQEVVCPERGLRLLTTLAERKGLFDQVGIDRVVVIKFDHKLQNLTAEQFVKKYLVGQLKATEVFVGYDYAFGAKRSGEIAHLKRLGEKFGFKIVVVPPVKLGGQPVKSSVIRELVSSGKFNQAVRLLGHPYRISGKVVRGRGVGKGLGFPTANLSVVKDKLIPAHGVYAGYVNGKKCAVNIGDRPTFGLNQPEVEVHILNFKGNLRGKLLQVDLFKRLREEKQFSDVEKLISQIRRDVKRIALASYL